MIPIRDSIRSTNKPVMTRLIIFINILVFIFQYFIISNQANEFVYVFGFFPVRLSEPFFLYSLITSVFMHGSLTHLISNMWVLWIFGDNVEDKMGRSRFLFFYLLCGIIANLTHFAFNMSSTIPVVGASGAIAGVMGAYFIMYKKAQIVTVIPWFPPLFINIPAVVYLFIWFFTQVVSGTQEALSNGGSVSGIAWWAHIGGFIGGAILYRLFLNKRSTDIDLEM